VLVVCVCVCVTATIDVGVIVVKRESKEETPFFEEATAPTAAAACRSPPLRAVTRPPLSSRQRPAPTKKGKKD
jgi:hypothetical protein